MPREGLRWLPRPEILTFEEIERVTRVFVERFGITSVRITGGEPTVRAHLPQLIERLAAFPVELSMTTNGATLDGLARELRRAGLHRVTVSCDSLRPDRFAEITGRDMLGPVLAGIRAALESGLRPVKLNAVVVRDVNDDEVVELARFGRESGVEVRYIEFMPLDATGQWSADKVVPSAEVIGRISEIYPLEPMSCGPEPAQRYRYLDGGGTVGVVASVTKPFCADCDRVRITAEGALRSCLFAVRETDLRAILRGGGTDDDLAQAIAAEVWRKWAGHSIGKVQFVRPARSMSQIGG
jgi:cyclic pyranopterin phosphate synthase